MEKIVKINSGLKSGGELPKNCNPNPTKPRDIDM
jgi:hypothetical protein